MAPPPRLSDFSQLGSGCSLAATAGTSGAGTTLVPEAATVLGAPGRANWGASSADAGDAAAIRHDATSRADADGDASERARRDGIVEERRWTNMASFLFSLSNI